MATISGQLIFSIKRNNQIDSNSYGIGNIPIVLQNITTNERLGVLTESDGTYTFTQVPNGSYRIVLVYEYNGKTLNSPAAFTSTNTEVGDVPAAKLPPYTVLTGDYPTQTTDLSAVTPTTVFVTIENDEDVTAQTIFLGPTRYEEIKLLLDSSAIISPRNLLQGIDNGTFGEEPPGTQPNGGPAINPYPNITTGFTFIQQKFPIRDGYYSIGNTISPYPEFLWWRLSDRTTGIETGRMEIVNGAFTGEAFLTLRQTVDPFTNYVFLAWLVNVNNSTSQQAPKFGIQITGDSPTDILYDEDLGDYFNPSQDILPIWKEVGTAFNSGDNTSVGLTFYSLGEAASGNDYAVDDVRLSLITYPVILPTKTVNTTYATLNEIITYTIIVENINDNLLTNVSIKDTLSDNLEFVQGSVTINNVTDSTGNPNDGISVPDIQGQTTTTVTFQAKVISLPSNTILDNIATLNYDYTPLIGGIPNSFSEETENVSVYVGKAVIGGEVEPNSSFTKSVNEEYAQVGDILTYTIVAENIGNVEATNIVIEDNIPQGTTYIENSISSTVPFSGSPLTTINLTNPLLINEKATITYQVKVDEIPSTNPIQNSAKITYNYTENPDVINGATGTGITNTVNTLVVNPTISIVKSENITQAIVGDIVTYTINVQNTGNIEYTNVIVTDKLQSDLTFVDGSLTINNNPSDENITSGALVGTLGAGESVTLVFKAKVNSANIINNNATVDYTVVTGATSTNYNKTSNTVEIQSYNIPILEVTKTSSKENLYVGDIFTYTINVKNTGDITVSNVIISDLLPPQFKVTKIEINNVDINSTQLDNLNIGNLLPDESKNIVVTILVLSNNLSNFINKVETNGTSQLNEENEPTSVTASATSTNSVTTIKPEPNISIFKLSNITEGILGNVVTYTLDIENTGNIEATNVVITDDLPSDLTFVEGSLIVNNNPSDENILNGISLGNLAIDEKATIIFKATITSIPLTNLISNSAKADYTVVTDSNTTNYTNTSNEVEIQVYNIPTLEITKTSSDENVYIGNEFTYTINVTNTGDVSISDVIISDVLPSQFVITNIKINDKNANTTELDNLNLGNIGPKENKNIVITVLVEGNTLTNFQNTVSSKGTVQVNDANEPTEITASATSNNSVTTVEPAPSILIIKSENITEALEGDVVTYTIDVENTGNIQQTNVIVKDELQTYLTFVEGSLIINNEPSDENILNGIMLGNLDIGEKATIIFKAEVSSIPQSNIINNNAKVEYTVITDSTTTIYNETSNTVDLKAYNIPNLEITKTSSDENVYVGNEFTYTINVKNTGEVSISDVIISDELPYQFKIIKIEINNENIFTTVLDNLNIGNIEPNESKNIVVTILVLSNSLSNFVNSVSAKGTVQLNNENPQREVSASTTSTNSVTTVEPNPSVSIVKSQNLTQAVVGNIVTYTLLVENTGNIELTNAVVTDELQSDLTFVEGSLTINNEPSDENISTGVSLGTLDIGQKVTITFKAEINNVNTIENNAKINYTVVTDSSTTNYTKTSNTVQIQVYNIPSLQVTKTASTENVYVGNEFTYTINVKNTGEISILNVIISDLLPSQFLVTNIKVNDKNANTTELDNLNLGSIGANETINVVVTILVKSNTLSNFKNTVSTKGEVQVNNVNEPIQVIASASSNNLVTTIEPSPSISITKSANITEAIVGNIITYTINVENTGNIDVTNVIITDELQSNLTFVDGSLIINNEPSDENISEGIMLGTLAIGQKTIIIFKAEINNENNISNNAQANYTVVTDISVTNYNETSNTVETKVYKPSLEVTKTSSEENVFVGNEFTYTINVKNTGNVTVSNVTISDSLPPQFQIIKIEINNENTFTTILDNLNIGNILPNESKNIVVTILVLSNTLSNFKNKVSVEGTSQVNDANLPTVVTSSATTNESITTVEPNPSISIVKMQNITEAIVGNIVTYTLDIENTGNIELTNVIVTDELQLDLTFVEGSLIVNNEPSDENISEGVNLGTLAVGQKATIIFKAEVKSENIISNSGKVEYTVVTDSSTTNYTKTSNIVQLQVFAPSLEVTKTSSEENVYVGGEFTYTINVKNTGVLTVSDIILSDVLPPQFEITKIEINNIDINSTDLNNLNIGNLSPNESKNIVVTIQVLSNTLSNFKNAVSVEGTSQVNDANSPTNITASATSNNSITTIDPNSSISIVKSVDVNTVFVSEIVTYTLVVKNTGNIILSNLVVSDELSQQLTFEENSITINGTQVEGNIISGINVGNLNIGEEITIKFKARVNSISPSTTISNYSQVTYDVVLTETKTYTQQSNTVEITVENFEISITKESSKQNIFVGETFTYTITLQNLGTIPILNVILNDELPQQLTVTNISINGEDANTTELNGLNIGTINVNETITVIVTVKVTSNNLTNFQNTVIATGTVQSNPSNPPKTVGGIGVDSQSINTIKPITTLTIEKSQSTEIALLCEVVTYTLTITNTGNITYSNLLVIDKLSPKLTFIQNSLTINGESSDKNINTGVEIEALNPGETVVVTFEAIINNICDNLKISNSATVLYSVILSSEIINLSSVSNKVYLQPQKLPLKVCQKTDKECVCIGNQLCYEITIKNKSNLTFGSKDDPVILHLNLPPNTVYVPKSLTINLNHIRTNNLLKEIDLGIIPPYSFKVITFKVYVSSYDCNPIKNSSYISYTILDKNNKTITQNIESNTTCTFIK